MGVDGLVDGDRPIQPSGFVARSRLFRSNPVRQGLGESLASDRAIQNRVA
ncbi:hypothetical protein [Synechococcus elongatus]|nr:hypothetical protein [Synechococcus elongatus]MBD2586890.1 hypothetical protein [Synechococcus elongatus FACHB-242]MBD2687961.1 hypothetical protein [Synechococcus elongatus FACHB-1061]MBD2706328.1 hypothetical protein [Synechococcus elongatus PCC 7942 = FACHB-805]WKW05118.1 hypothetical protein QY054_11085 [Synechococcus elongatus PCC 7942 = FACHB-805]